MYGQKLDRAAENEIISVEASCTEQMLTTAEQVHNSRSGDVTNRASGCSPKVVLSAKGTRRYASSGRLFRRGSRGWRLERANAVAAPANIEMKSACFKAPVV